MMTRSFMDDDIEHPTVQPMTVRCGCRLQAVLKQCYAPLDQILQEALEPADAILQNLHQVLVPQIHGRANSGQKTPVEQCQGHRGKEGPMSITPLKEQKTVHVQGEDPLAMQCASAWPPQTTTTG